jgi:hypothetical protein
MKLSDFKKLEESIQQQDFSKSFKNINNVLFYLSIFGHLASIFLAYFLISKILSGAITNNPIIVTISSIILLFGLEALKREIFDKFSLQQIKHKSVKHSDVLPLMLVSILIVSISFYSSIKGAQEFSSKSKQIDNEIRTNSKRYADSLTSEINKKINSIESHKVGLMDMRTKLQSSIVESKVSKQQEKLMRELEVQSKEDDSKIKSYRDELESNINSYEEELKKEGDGRKNENKNNSFFFVIISTLIELLILAGVYFNEYYKYRSYLEIKDKIDSDPLYQKWFYCNNIVNIIYTDDTKINDKLPSIRSIIDICKLNSLVLLPKDVSDLFKLFSSLGIIRGTSTKYINKNKESAQEILRKHFNIEK